MSSSRWSNTRRRRSGSCGRCWGGKRLRFTDAQRGRLALKAKALSRRALAALDPLVTPDTLCRWFRKYAGAKYDSSAVRRPGRPPKPEIVRELVVRLANENAGWGYADYGM